MDEEQPQQPQQSPQQISPQARLQQLLAIPDKSRTDEQWDELNELEIKLASVNRQGAPMPTSHRPGGGQPQRNDRRGGGGGGGGGGRNQGKKFHGRRPRPA
jgi:hypothetical protein